MKFPSRIFTYRYILLTHYRILRRDHSQYLALDQTTERARLPKMRLILLLLAVCVCSNTARVLKVSDWDRNLHRRVQWDDGAAAGGFMTYAKTILSSTFGLDPGIELTLKDCASGEVLGRHEQLQQLDRMCFSREAAKVPVGSEDQTAQQRAQQLRDVVCEAFSVMSHQPRRPTESRAGYLAAMRAGCASC